MKKNYAILLVLTFLLQCLGLPTVTAQNNGWTVTYFGDYTEESVRDSFSGELSTKYKAEGTQSLLVKCRTSEKKEGSYIEVKNPLTKELESGKYNLSLYVKISGEIDGRILFGDSEIDISEDVTKTETTVTGEKNWKIYSVEIDYTKTDDNFLRLIFEDYIKSAYLDNVVLTAEGSDENLVVDPGFEGEITTEGTTGSGGDDSGNTGGDNTNPDDGTDTGGGNLDDGKPYDTNPYQPVSIMSSGYKSGVLLTWKNPSTATLTDIKVYDITSGEEVLLSDDIPTNPSKVIYFKHECTGETPNQYKVVFSYSDKEDRIYWLSEFPGDKGAQMSGGWSLREYMDGAAKYCPADVYIDTTTGYESGASLKIVSNIDRSISELQSNIYVLVVRTTKMEAGKKYYISFMVKGENVVNAPQAHMNFVKFEDSANTVSGVTGTTDWTKKEHTYVYTKQNALTVLVEGMCGGLWFDNFECYELDANGEKVGENLISDGDFDSIISRTTGKITDLKAEPGIGSVNVSFKKPVEKYNGANIYQKVYDNYEYRGTISANIDNLNITGLQENKEYTFKIVPFNSDRCEGEANEFTVKTILRDYDITEPVCYKGNTKVTALSGNGEYKLVTKAKNNLLDTNLEYEQLVGIYEGNTLVKVYSTKQSLAKTEQNAPYTDTETTFTVPDGENVNVKIFVVEKRKNPELYYRMELK